MRKNRCCQARREVVLYKKGENYEKGIQDRRDIAACAFGAAVLIVLGYVIYVAAEYDRIEDYLQLTVDEGATEAEAQTGVEYGIVTYNIGFGAYSPDFSLFLDSGENVGTCRAAEIPYTEGVNYQTVLDGFIVSDNVEVTKVRNIDTGYEFSDHNPVEMTFVLK